MILIIIKFCELLLRISQRIINSLRSYIKHSKECFLRFPNTSKLVKRTRLRLVFLTYFSVFGNRRKHSSACLIYFFSHLYPNNANPNNFASSAFFCTRVSLRFRRRSTEMVHVQRLYFYQPFKHLDNRNSTSFPGSLLSKSLKPWKQG